MGGNGAGQTTLLRIIREMSLCTAERLRSTAGRALTVGLRYNPIRRQRPMPYRQGGVRISACLTPPPRPLPVQPDSCRELLFLTRDIERLEVERVIERC
ncbi:hypothetical protein [Orlajensenia flava]|uniref:hypothetical protein n=1 Tax=Orlajensenia flava TaxID=2565934 RepID=UPI001F3EC938|nr:hypothetical protein [Glaciibacter flavus]